jgi:DNA-binding transcriptional LysR family regulator
MSHVDLRDIDAFVAVARTRNFRRAALEQHVSVSSLSQRLPDLEERFGVRLMNRTTRSVGLTEAGEWLLARDPKRTKAIERAVAEKPSL